MAQFARPNNDDVIGAWTDDVGGTTNIYTTIDEVSASDADYIESEADPSSSICDIGLSALTDPVGNVDHIVRYRYQKRMSGGGSPGVIDLSVALQEGVTVRASQSHVAILEGFVAGTFTLSGAEADAITDYTNLSLRFIANMTGGTRTSFGDVSWAEFEVPDATSILTTSVADTAAFSDDVALALFVNRAEAATVALSDDITVTAKHRRAPNDTAAFSDNVLRAGTYKRVSSDTAGLSDNVLIAVQYRRAVTDTLALSTPDLADLSRLIDVPFDADTLALSDDVSAAAQAATPTISVADTVAFSDSVALAAKYRRTAIDTAAFSDDATLTAKYRRTISDTAAFSDNVALATSRRRSEADTVGFADNVLIAVKYRRLLSDTLAIADNFLRAGTYQRTVTDTLALSDDVSTLVPVPGSITVDDTLALSDNVAIRGTFRRANADTVGLSDNVLIAVKYRRSLSNTMGFSDLVSTGAAAIGNPWNYYAQQAALVG